MFRGLRVSFGFAWVHSGPPRGRRVHSGSRRFTRAVLGVVAFIQVRLDSLRRDYGSFRYA